MSRPGRHPGPGLLAAAVLAGLGLIVSSAVAAEQAAESPPRLLDLEGRLVDPLTAETPAPTAFVFVRTDCPIANRYAPELRRLHDDYAGQGVRLFLVYADADETPEIIREHLAEYGHSAPALRDVHHDLVRRTGVRMTPEAAVYSPAGTLVYRGRIDDRHVEYGRSRPRATRTDLRDVLDRLVAGETPALTTTRPVGCFIAPLDGP